MVNQVLLVSLVHPETKVIKDLKDPKVVKACKVLVVSQADRANPEKVDLQVYQAKTAIQVKKEVQETLVWQEDQVSQELGDHQGLTEVLEHQESKEHQVHQESEVLKANRE